MNLKGKWEMGKVKTSHQSQSVSVWHRRSIQIKLPYDVQQMNGQIAGCKHESHANKHLCRFTASDELIFELGPHGHVGRVESSDWYLELARLIRIRSRSIAAVAAISAQFAGALLVLWLGRRRLVEQCAFILVECNVLINSPEHGYDLWIGVGDQNHGQNVQNDEHSEVEDVLIDGIPVGKTAKSDDGKKSDKWNSQSINSNPINRKKNLLDYSSIFLLDHDNELWYANQNREHPNDQDDDLGTKLGGLKLKRIDDGVVSFIWYRCQSHDADANRDVLRRWSLNGM